MPRRFKAATWNALATVSVERLEPVLERLEDAGVTIVLGQEMRRHAHYRLFIRRGWHVIQDTQHLVAWRPETWTALSSGGGPISTTEYARKGGRPDVETGAAWAVLADEAGRTLDTLSYHTPAHVQVQNPPRRRLLALQEGMATLRRRARTTPACAALYGGDDNVDEARGFRRRFRFMRDAAMRPLRQIRAPRPTHGRRRIDDFRVKGLRAPGQGYVMPAPGDHGVFVHLFAFRR